VVATASAVDASCEQAIRPAPGSEQPVTPQRGGEEEVRQ
jgi:hypothetical protein